MLKVFGQKCRHGKHEIENMHSTGRNQQFFISPFAEGKHFIENILVALLRRQQELFRLRSYPIVS